MKPEDCSPSAGGRGWRRPGERGAGQPGPPAPPPPPPRGPPPAAAPDVIVLPESGLAALGGIEALLEIPGIAETPAGAAGAFLAYDEAYFFNLGPRAGVALMEFVLDLSPELESGA